MKTLPEILDAAEMAETYPQSNELNFGEVGLSTLYDWAQQVKGTPYSCGDCDIESVMRTFERWWKHETKRAYRVC